MQDLNSSFYVQCIGQIESADFGSIDNIYCRYLFSFGPDWSIVGGLDTGLSQTARKGLSGNEVVWNFPIDITFRTTNVFGWPRIALCVYGLDFLGRDVIRGYASILVPLSPGLHDLEVETYVPISNSVFNQFFSWLAGNPPEFFDPKFVCQSLGREVTRVQGAGRVRVKLQILTKGMSSAGYSLPDRPLHPSPSSYSPSSLNTPPLPSSYGLPRPSPDLIPSPSPSPFLSSSLPPYSSSSSSSITSTPPHSSSSFPFPSPVQQPNRTNR